MINPKLFYQKLLLSGINTFYGVPDSLLKDFCAYVDDYGNHGNHIITANEGNAIGIATGYHLATGQIAAVYMQNSGLGNAINPLTSLTDPAVYKIPMLLIIGWRGEPNVKDEPQHVKQGEITTTQLDLLGIPYILLEKTSIYDEVVEEAIIKIKKLNSPVAILVKKGAFSEYTSMRIANSEYTLKREDALRLIIDLSKNSLIVSTTGKTSREVFEIRNERRETQRDFLTVGGMGHTSSIALGVALGQPNRRVVCLDGDGSLIMHMGALAIIGSILPSNYVHILLNNASHESVGGQPTVGGKLDFQSIAKASGYKQYFLAKNEQDIVNTWNMIKENEGPILIEILICQGSREDLGRPSTTPEQNKLSFMKYINV